MTEEITIKNESPRRTMLVAVVIAVVLAGAAWYALFGRVQDTTDTDLYSPTALNNEDIATNPQTINQLEPAPTTAPASTPTLVPTSQGQVAGQSVPTDAPTGTPELLLAGALAALFGGSAGIRYSRRANNS